MRSPAILLTAFILSIAGGSAQNLRNGDLLFEAAGNSEFSEAIASATAAGDSLRFVHVAILKAEPDGGFSVIEASPKEGVRSVALQDFLDGAPRINGAPAVVVMRLEKDFSAAEAIERAERYLGEPYDWWYMPDNGRMYCSELVYEAYLDADGNHIFGSRPMNFRNPDGTMPRFWEELYGELGVPVPEGLPGTNPHDLSRDPGLKEVCRFF